jgi:hypothetical protein
MHFKFRIRTLIKMNAKKFPFLGYKMPRSSSSQTRPAVNYHPPAKFTNPYSSVGTPSRVEIEQPTLGQSLKQGFGFGAGSAIAHRLLNPFPTIAPSDKKTESPCEKERHAFETCMKTKSAEDFCGEQQMGYTQCLRILRGQS